MNKNFRIIPRLEIKSDQLIKGMRMEGLKKLGSPVDFALKYYNQLADEILYEDIVASLYNREINFKLVKEISNIIQIPLILAGRLRDLKDMKKAFNSGADKIALNTYALKNPRILINASRTFGSQSIAALIQFKKINEDYEVFSESGRVRHNIKLFDWIEIVQKNGIGEIILISIDNDGVNSEINFKILEEIRMKVNVPLLYGGGIRNQNQIEKLINLDFDGACISHSLHFDILQILTIKQKYNNKIKKYTYL